MHNIVWELLLHLIFLLIRIRLLHFPFVEFKHTHIQRSFCHHWIRIEYLFLCFSFLHFFFFSMYIVHFVCALLCFTYSIFCYDYVSALIKRTASRHTTLYLYKPHMIEFQQSVAVIITAAAAAVANEWYRGHGCCWDLQFFIITHYYYYFFFPSFEFSQCKSAITMRDWRRCYFHCNILL